jgi:hypothetical protein
VRLPDGSAAAFEADPGGIPEEERPPDEPDDLSDPGEPVREDESHSSDDDSYKGGDFVGRTDSAMHCAVRGSRSLGLPQLQISRRAQGGDGEEVVSDARRKVRTSSGQDESRPGRGGKRRDAVEMEVDVKPSHRFHFGVTVCVI